MPRHKKIIVNTRNNTKRFNDYYQKSHIISIRFMETISLTAWPRHKRFNVVISRFDISRVKNKFVKERR